MPWYEYTAIAGAPPRPFVEVRLWRGDRNVRLIALVDSGADYSLLDAGYAEILGLDRGSARTEESTSAGGSAFTTLHWPAESLELQFERDRFPFLGRFVEFLPGSDAMNLLGRDDFFRQFVVQFWEAADLMNIDQSPEFAHSSLA